MIGIKTLCGRCAMGCGVRAMPGDDRRLLVEGDRIHPANMGWLCPEGEGLADVAGLEGRLLHPLVGGRRVTRDRAVAQAARRLSDIIARHGPASIALHVAGDLPTEDYYAANKWMKGFIGSAHIDSPWTDAAARAHLAAFGEDVMPASGEDIDGADLILLFGADTLRRHPRLRHRVAMTRAEGGALLAIVDADPAAQRVPADLHVAPAAGTQGLLLGGLLLHAHDAGLVDKAYLAQRVQVPAGYWDGLRPGHDLWSVARGTGLAPGVIRALQDMIGGAGRMVTLFDPDREAGAAREAAAILTLHLATGRIGKPGAGPFALPGAPNAMGAREAGCGAGALAAHRGFSDAALESVGRFWSASRLAREPGLSGEALTQAIGEGRIRALVMLGEAPADWMEAMPAARPFTLFAGDRLDRERIDIALPMAGALERDGTITSADRLISRQRPVFPLPGDAKPGWWIVTQIARAMGWHDAFHYERPAEIYREHARLSAYHDDGRRLFNLRRHAPVSNPAYQELTPWRWGELPFDEGRFPTDDGRARLVRFWD